MRVRADRAYGDPWMPDPDCYLNSEELSQEAPQSIKAMEADMLLEERAA